MERRVLRNWATLAALMLVSQAALAQRWGGYSDYDRMGRPIGDHSHHRSFQQEIEVKIRDHFQGQNVIRLKKEMKQQNPYLNLQNKVVTKVILKAKSKHGRGKASLKVGPYMSPNAIIGGNPYDFDTRGRFTMDRVTLFGSFDEVLPGDKIQVHLKGNIKVGKIIVVLEDAFGRGMGRGRHNRGGMGRGPIGPGHRQPLPLPRRSSIMIGDQVLETYITPTLQTVRDISSSGMFLLSDGRWYDSSEVVQTVQHLNGISVGDTVLETYITPTRQKVRAIAITGKFLLADGKWYDQTEIESLASSGGFGRRGSRF